MVVPHDRHELVHVGRHEGVGVVEALAARPAVEGPDLRDLVERRVVPFAERVVHVARLLEVVRDGLGRVGHDGVVAGEAHRGERMAAQTDGVRVASGHQRRARGRAERRRVEVVVAQAVLGEGIDVRRLDQAAEAADLSETRVVQQEDDDIRSVLVRSLLRRPPLL